MPDYPTYAVPRADLGVPLLEYIQNQLDFIAMRVLPILKVDKKAATFSAIRREGLTQRAKTARAPRGAYNRVNFAAEDVAYACEEHGLELPVDHTERKRFANDFDADMHGAMIVQNILLREQEIRTAAICQDVTATGWLTTNSALYTDIATTWVTVATATPIGDVASAKLKVLEQTGVEPDTLVINNINLGYLKNNTDIKGRLKYVTKASPENILAALAEMLELKRILVGKSVYNASPEGDTAFVAARIWSSSYALVCKTCDEGPATTPGIGRTPLWVSDSPEAVMVEQYEEVQTRSTIHRVRQHVDEKLTGVEFGHMLKVD